jgi:hypothetical protein
MRSNDPTVPVLDLCLLLGAPAFACLIVGSEQIPAIREVTKFGDGGGTRCSGRMTLIADNFRFVG